MTPVFDLLQEGKVEVIDLAETLKGRETRSLVVNAMDYHPNEAVHEEVGDLIFERLQARGIP